MDGSDNDGINIVLIAGTLAFALLICAMIGGLVWLYGRQSGRRVKERQATKKQGE